MSKVTRKLRARNANLRKKLAILRTHAWFEVVRWFVGAWGVRGEMRGEYGRRRELGALDGRESCLLGLVKVGGGGVGFRLGSVGALIWWIASH